MICWNCNREMPDSAKVCLACESPGMDAPTAAEIDAVRELFQNMPPEALADLRRAFSESDTAEGFADRIFVGDCPKCGSKQTGNCEHDPEIEELLVGRCYNCSHLWCTECEKPLAVGATECPCWEEEDEDEDLE